MWLCLSVVVFILIQSNLYKAKSQESLGHFKNCMGGDVPLEPPWLSAYTRPGSAQFHYTVLDWTPKIPRVLESPRVAIFQKLLRSTLSYLFSWVLGKFKLASFIFKRHKEIISNTGDLLFENEDKYLWGQYFLILSSVHMYTSTI